MSDLLTDDHAELGGLLGGLTAEFEGGDAGAALAKLDYVWARLAVHIRAEHLHLFPALLAAAAGGAERTAAVGGLSPAEVRAAVERLREDHDFFMRELAACVNTLRDLSARAGDADAERLEAVRQKVLAVGERLGGHNRLEEDEVYRWPALLLGAAEGERLEAAMRRELENMPPRFSARTDEDREKG
jgi:hypothetical protein